jgi:hypothetical protein
LLLPVFIFCQYRYKTSFDDDLPCFCDTKIVFQTIFVVAALQNCEWENGMLLTGLPFFGS